MNKAKAMDRLWHDDKYIEEKFGDAVEYDFSNIDSLKEFTGSHPAVMKDRIARQNWQFAFDVSQSKMKLKYRVKRWIEQRFGIIIGEYRNYRLV